MSRQNPRMLIVDDHHALFYSINAQDFAATWQTARSSVILTFAYFGRMLGKVAETLEYNRCEINHSDLYASVFTVQIKR